MFDDLLALLFPESCFACDEAMARGEKFICTSCNVKLPYTDSHIHGATEINQFQKRFWGKVPIRYVFAYMHFIPKGRVQRLLHKLKYKGAQELGEHLGSRFGSLLTDYHYAGQFDLIIPVPLHKAKQRRRGYNQSESFAKGLANMMNLDYEIKSLVRTMHTSTQTRKSRLDRWQNVEEVFKVIKAETIKGKHILLVDDVMTTGATLEACSVALLRSGAKDVSIAALAAA
jgi:ComF family protein